LRQAFRALASVSSRHAAPSDVNVVRAEARQVLSVVLQATLQAFAAIAGRAGPTARSVRSPMATCLMPTI
jgi:hypothetical protein